MMIDEVHRVVTFIQWVNQNLKNTADQSYQYNGDDVYAARYGILHSWSAFSEHGAKKGCKMFGYHDGSEHMTKADVTNLVLISIPRLVNDFIKALECFFASALQDLEFKERIDHRLPKLYAQFNVASN